jgi:metal-responsive CopG/Arc/MetJ family transcriptional regulator
MMMETSLLEKIDAYRITNRIWSRSEAIRTLINESLQRETPVSAGE